MIQTPTQMSVKHVVELDEKAGTVLVEGYQKQRYRYKIAAMHTDYGADELRENFERYQSQVAPIENVYSKFHGPVYVAGPYTHGGVEQNVRNAIDAANQLADRKIAPFVPHLFHAWHLVHERPYDFWCDLDNLFLFVCKAVLRLPGHSPGTVAEVRLARLKGIPVFDSIDEVTWHFDRKSKAQSDTEPDTQHEGAIDD